MLQKELDDLNFNQSRTDDVSSSQLLVQKEINMICRERDEVNFCICI